MRAAWKSVWKRADASAVIVVWDMMGEPIKLRTTRRTSVITGKRAHNASWPRTTTGQMIDGAVDAHSGIVIWFTP